MTTRKFKNYGRRRGAPWVELHSVSWAGTGAAGGGERLDQFSHWPAGSPAWENWWTSCLSFLIPWHCAWLSTETWLRLDAPLHRTYAGEAPGCSAPSLWFPSNMHFCLTSAGSPTNAFSPQTALATEWGNCFTWWKVLLLVQLMAVW